MVVINNIPPNLFSSYRKEGNLSVALATLAKDVKIKAVVSIIVLILRGHIGIGRVRALQS